MLPSSTWKEPFNLSCSFCFSLNVCINKYHQHLTWVLFQHQVVTYRNMSQLWNSSWLYFPKLPYILQAYQHTCLQRNEAGERVSSRMVGIGKSVLFSTSTSKAFWMESNNCSMSLLVSPRLPCSCSPLAALELYVNKTTITAIKLLILRSFQKRGCAIVA